MPPFSATPERSDRYRGPSLEHILRRHEAVLTAMAQPNHPLTLERMRGRVPMAADIVTEATHTGIDWPTKDSAVPSRLNVKSREYFLADAERSDTHFTYEVVQGQRSRHSYHGFNNFPAILRSKPYKPQNRHDFQQAMSADPSGALYGSKPYLLRAYMVAPEFMGALQSSVKACGGSAEWGEAMIRGGLEPDEYPADAALLRSSRLAYGLLSNLMRSDDLQRQSQWLGFGTTQQAISDPHVELWT